jgi:nitroimidazol reductase NimA-like FMN-containing flavoprotein (pyridoxamine 5'-phosphate oxidase superfamily)
MTFAMTKAGREAFLADLRVGILAVNEEGRAPLAAPVWYRYAPGGDIYVVTGENSRKMKALRLAGRASFTVQTEAAPYKYVSVEGPASFEAPDFERDIREMAHRYLGPAAGEAYLKSSGSRVEGNTLVRIKPERWLSVDYGS